MSDNNVTLDYDGEPLVPPPASNVIRQYLRRSFSVADLFKRAFRGWTLGLFGLVLGFMVGLYSIWSTPPRYYVSIGLLPTETAGSDIGESGALGALAGLVGLSSGPVPKFTRFVSSLYATGVAELMDKKYDMICRSYSGYCDRKTRKWRKSDTMDAKWDRVVADVAHLPDPDRPRTAYDLARYTESNVQFSSDKATHILTLSMEGTDPKFMSMFLTNLVQSANDYIKDQDRSVIQQYVDYLYAKLATNTNVSQRDALSSLVLEQERRLMLTSVNVPYAASVQDGPNVSSSGAPARTLLVDSFLGAILGAVLGIMLSFIPRGSAWRRPIWRSS
jgi:hypothetical protein